MVGGNPEITIHARPGRNGSPPKHFMEAAYDLNAKSHQIEEDILCHMVELFHGRNYQHLEDAEARRAEDLEILDKLRAAQTLLREVGNTLGQIGVRAMKDDN